MPWALLGLILSGGCGPERESQRAVTDAVAWVAGEPIRVAELEAEIRRGNGLLAPGLSAAEVRKTVLEDLVRNRVILHRARAEGLVDDPETQRRIQGVIRSVYLEKHGPDPEALGLPTDEEIQTAYQSRREEWRSPARSRLGLIHLKGSAKATPEKALEQRRRAEELHAQLVARRLETNAFSELAAAHSDDRASRYRGGDVGWVDAAAGARVQAWPAEVLEALGKLQAPGELSPLVETASGFYLLKLLERREAGIRPLAEVRDPLVHQLVRERKKAQADQFEAELRAGVAIDIREDVLAGVAVPQTRLVRTEPPSFPSIGRR